jgi:hypothetical protein
MHTKLLEGHLVEMLAKAGLPNAERRGRQIWILSEGVIALSVTHGDRNYCTAAEGEDISLSFVATQRQDAASAVRPPSAEI